MLASPLMLGNDPRHMSAATRRILTARGLLAINQDPSGLQAERIWRDGPKSIWRKALADGSHALLLFNGGDTKADNTKPGDTKLATRSPAAPSLATPSLAALSLATPSLATPSPATPSVATPSPATPH